MAIDVGFKTEKPFEELIVTPGDLTLGSIVFGFFFGFAIHVVWSAVKETRRARRFSAYIFMIWLEIVADIGFAIVAWGYLAKLFPPGLGVFLSVIVCWICQVQCLMLIIVNRLCILYSDDKQRRILRFTTAGIVTAISLSTACIWIPAQLQINHTYIWLNHWWDRFEKSVYLLLDLTLNILFIRVVKTRLINYGLKKYDRVMKLSSTMPRLEFTSDPPADSTSTSFLSPSAWIFTARRHRTAQRLCVLPGKATICTPIPRAYHVDQFHPVVYIVKLHIEMTMSQLLIKVARSTGINVYNEEKGRVTSDTVSGNKTTHNNNVQVHVDTQVFTTRHMDDFEMSPRDHKDIPEISSVNSASGDTMKVSPV
ncbi:hypothetical protein CPB85DRAFT_1436270 [Mucidula mucida]|nr:hypothetical protein CPB85DRAFT_1436270 [Mucidula mucida]